MDAWAQKGEAEDLQDIPGMETYDIPWLRRITNLSFMKYVPISPAFKVRLNLRFERTELRGAQTIGQERFARALSKWTMMRLQKKYSRQTFKLIKCSFYYFKNHANLY